MTRSIVIVFPRWMDDHGRSGEQHAFVRFERVVRSLAGVSPLIEVESIGTMVIAARGPSRYFGGDVAVARAIEEVLTESGVDGPWGTGIADSRFAATAAAHLAVSRGRPCVIESSVHSRFIGGLPVEALSRVGGITDDTVGLLLRLGLRTCSALVEVGESALIDRFGVEGKRIHQLVSGGEVRHLAPGAPPSDFTRAVEFEFPLADPARVVATVRPVVDELVRCIDGHGQQCIRLLLSCQTDHAENTSRIWGEPRGFTVAGISQRLSCQLEGWLVDESAIADAPTSGIVRVVFEPLECRQVLATQQLLWGGQQENTERAARAAAMAMATGDDVRISVPRWEGGRDVTSVYSQMPLALVDLTDVDAARQRIGGGDDAVRDWSGSVPRPSPASVAPGRPPLRVLDAHGHEVAVTGRHELSAVPVRVEMADRHCEVLRMAGPWPVEERWWDARRRRRQVRMQLLVREPRTGNERVLLLGLENRRWSLLARYD